MRLDPKSRPFFIQETRTRDFSPLLIFIHQKRTHNYLIYAVQTRFEYGPGKVKMFEFEDHPVARFGPEDSNFYVFQSRIPGCTLSPHPVQFLK